jgi:alpha-beta hydrolase superfamily lysophospholipase
MSRLFPHAPPRRAVYRHETTIRADRVVLPGTLTVPRDAVGIVVFAHGSGSSRLSPRNIEVAEALNDAGFATLLFDLLTDAEAADRRNVFDVVLLADRVGQAVEWLLQRPDIIDLPVGLFGASTGAAAALAAAADLGDPVRAVVSRGGRPDLAADRLHDVAAPTLLVVGELDEVVIELNRGALAKLRCRAELRIVPGATHLFEEPGALEQVADLAAAWFYDHLRQ